MTDNHPGTGSTASFERWAGAAAIATSLGGVLYSAAFLGGVVLGLNPELGILVASAALLIGGLLSTVVLVAVYRRVSPAAGEVALIGLVFALMGALGASSTEATTWRSP